MSEKVQASPSSWVVRSRAWLLLHGYWWDLLQLVPLSSGAAAWRWHHQYACRPCMKAASLLTSSLTCLLKWQQSSAGPNIPLWRYIYTQYTCMKDLVYLYERKNSVKGQEATTGILHVKEMPCDIQLLLSSLIFFGLSLQKSCWFSLSPFTVTQVYSNWFFLCSELFYSGESHCVASWCWISWS